MNLSGAFASLQKLFPGTRQLGILRDHFGVYAYSITSPSGRQYLFCFKNSAKGNVASIHVSLLNESARTSIPILMWLKDTPYQLTHSDIIRTEKFRNKRNGATMVNFPIYEIGQNLYKKNSFEGIAQAMAGNGDGRQLTLLMSGQDERN